MFQQTCKVNGIIFILKMRKLEVQGGYIDSLNHKPVPSRARIKPDSSDPNGYTLSTRPDSSQHCTTGRGRDLVSLITIHGALYTIANGCP